MTNKELAVQLYSALLQASATAISSPNCTAKAVEIPSAEKAVAAVAELTKLLSSIEDN